MTKPSVGVTYIDRISTAIQALIIVAFVANTANPVPALAFTETITPTTLNFIKDEDLADTALMGNEMWPPKASIDPRHQYQWTGATDIKTGTTIAVLATAYTSSPEETDGNPWITASGTTVHQGTLAANFLPFGAQVQINGQTYTVEDRLSPRFNGKHVVDMWFADRAAALQFGVRVVQATIVSLP